MRTVQSVVSLKRLGFKYLDQEAIDTVFSRVIRFLRGPRTFAYIRAVYGVRILRPCHQFEIFRNVRLIGGEPGRQYPEAEPRTCSSEQCCSY